MTGDLCMFKLQHLSGMYYIYFKNVKLRLDKIIQNCKKNNCWSDWARFRPDLNHEAILKARPERDKARQSFCHTCVIASDINLFCLSPIMWQKWVRKSDNGYKPSPFFFHHCTKTFVMPHVYYLWNLACVSYSTRSILIASVRLIIFTLCVAQQRDFVQLESHPSLTQNFCMGRSFLRGTACAVVS